LHRSRILNHAFRNLKPVALIVPACLCFGCVHQIHRQYEARAISASSLPIEFALHNRIGLVTGLSPAAECLIASEPLAKGIQDNSFFIKEAYNQEPGVVQHIFNLPIDFTNGSRKIARVLLRDGRSSVRHISSPTRFRTSLRKTITAWRTYGSTIVCRHLWKTNIRLRSRRVYRLCFRPAIKQKASALA
jgi:hypothetical protein